MNPTIVRCLGMLAILAATAPRSADAGAPAGHYVVPAEGQIQDSKSGLTWEQTVLSRTYSWDEAKTHCSSFAAGDWRLPTIKELLSIVDSSEILPAVDPNAFPSTPSERFWSSSPFAGSPSSAWYVDFDLGQSFIGSVSDALSVRCVH
jgi:hypothetical protein